MNSIEKKGHVLFIVENNSVPPDIRVWREAKTVKKAGYEVSIIAPINNKFRKKEEVVDGIHIYRHPYYEHNGGAVKQIIEYINAFIWEVWLSIKIYKKKRFHIIHAANPPDNIFLIALLFKLSGVKFIFDHHDISPELFRCKFGNSNNLIYNLLRVFEKFSSKTADTIISTNQSFKNYIIKIHNVNPNIVYVVRNDPEVEVIANNLTKNKENIKLLYVGSLNVQDGIDILIKVIHRLIRVYNHNNIECTIVGDGDSLQMAKKLALSLGIKKFIDFTGYIFERKIVNSYLQDADICLETAPDNEANRRSTFIKIMEYMSFGKPIVAFDLDETRASVEKTAILIDPGNIEEFAQKVHDLMMNPIKRQEIGNAARKRIVEHLNWKNSTNILLSAYDKIEIRI